MEGTKHLLQTPMNHSNSFEPGHGDVSNGSEQAASGSKRSLWIIRCYIVGPVGKGISLEAHIFTAVHAA